MVKLFNQISFSDTYQECKDTFQNDKPKFLELLTQHFDLSSLVPPTFYWSYYKVLGRDRKYSLLSMLVALILQKILGIPTVSLLILFLVLCVKPVNSVVSGMYPITLSLPGSNRILFMTLKIFSTIWLTLPNPFVIKLIPTLLLKLLLIPPELKLMLLKTPKFLNSIIKKLKRAYKNNPDVDVYKMAYGLMPSSASANKDVKQLFINGYFCYVYKFSIITNGLGIVRHISFLDEDFKSKHPEIELDKKSDSPDEDKSISDSKALKPVLTDFFNLHPDSHYDTFLGDSIFDSFATYPMLMDEFKFKKVLIPLNPRNSDTGLPTPGFNEDGWPLCPNDPSKTMTLQVGPEKKVGVTDSNGLALWPPRSVANILLSVLTLVMESLVEECSILLLVRINAYTPVLLEARKSGKLNTKSETLLSKTFSISRIRWAAETPRLVII